MLRMVLIAVTVYGGVLLLLYWKQEVLLFAPTRLPPDHRFTVAGVVERKIEVEGATLSALHFRQPDPTALLAKPRARSSAPSR